MKKIEIPKNECKGCAARDKIIARLAKALDELSGAAKTAMKRNIKLAK